MPIIANYFPSIFAWNWNQIQWYSPGKIGRQRCFQVIIFPPTLIFSFNSSISYLQGPNWKRLCSESGTKVRVPKLNLPPVFTAPWPTYWTTDIWFTKQLLSLSLILSLQTCYLKATISSICKERPTSLLPHIPISSDITQNCFDGNFDKNWFINFISQIIHLLISGIAKEKKEWWRKEGY